MRGYTIVDPSTVISTHLTEVLKANVADLLSYAEVQKLLEDLPQGPAEAGRGHRARRRSRSPASSACCRPCSPSASRSATCRTILEGIAEAVGPPAIRADDRRGGARRASPASSARNTPRPGGNLPIITLSPRWEQAFAEVIVGEGDDRHLAMAPSRLQQFVTPVRDRFEDAARQGEIPVLLTSPASRPFVRSIIERFRAQTVVMSQNEVHPRVRLKTISSI